MRTKRQASHTSAKSPANPQSVKTLKKASVEIPSSASVAVLPAPDDSELYTTGVAVRIQDALDLYGVALDAACAFALLVADNIKYSGRSFAGWEDFASHSNFNDGVNELARMALSNASRQLKKDREIYGPMIERLRAFKGTLEILNRRSDAWSKAHERYWHKADSVTDLENAVNAMNDLIEMITLALSDRWKSICLSYHMGQIVQREFKAAYSELHLAMSDVHQAILSIGVQSEQRAAA